MPESSRRHERAISAHTYPVNYPNRESLVDQQEAASLSGRYYIAIAASNPDGTGQSVEIPFTLGADIEGDRAHVPDYNGDEPTIGDPGPSPESNSGESASDEASSDPADEPSEPSDNVETTSANSDGSYSLLLPIALGFAGIVFVELGALVIRTARR